ncbi:MerR family transcriptional regulator [Kribbella lupini]
MTYSIGELSRRTGLSVKTIRFYSDRGVVPTTRSRAGYRRYQAAALPRLELVRTLRDLGLPLTTIQQLLAGSSSLDEQIALEQAALKTQLQRLDAMSAAGRAALVEDFLSTVFQHPDSRLAAAQQSMVPELPAEASVEQLEAWVQLAELAQDAGFRELMRELVDGYTGDGLRPHDVARVRRAVEPALALGIDPRSPEAGDYLAAVGVVDVDQLQLAADVRRERYFDLLAVVNGWTTPDSPTDALRWYLEAASSRP